MKGSAGCAADLKMRFDPAKHLGALQMKILHMLNHEELLSEDEKSTLVAFYMAYQQPNRTRKMHAAKVMSVLGIWDAHFKGEEDSVSIELLPDHRER